MMSNVLLWVFGIVVIAIVAAFLIRGREEPPAANASKNIPPPSEVQTAPASPAPGAR